MLTGNEAVAAVQTLMGLGNAGARFSGRRVIAALRTGRARLVIVGLRRAQRLSPAFLTPGRPKRRESGSRRVQRLSAPPGEPAREPWVYVGAPGAPEFENGWGNA